MQKDWRDFKTNYGNIAGAREAFENACETLLKKKYASKYVSQMEVSRGDGGIDIFIGEYSREPIIVVQCKFFLEDFGSSQKEQIKKSFNKAFNNQDYELSEWILCIPRLFTRKDNEWWFEWKEKQDVDIKLINGNELIDLMKEYDVYNQIFQIEDSLKIGNIDKNIQELLTRIPKKESIITHLSNEKSFLNDIFIHIQRQEPVMLVSITSTPYHNKIAKYYKEKIYKLAIEKYSKKSVFSIYPPNKKDIDEAKYFSKLAKQCEFNEVIEDSFEFIEAIEQRLELQDVFLLISEFENGSD
ncbi:MAG: restriction endonuclease, partial [Sulfurovaceae bacterium]|nr:restriction endonuclease [Sulfurovaceae bacterium]